ncbi:MAG: hypothetical protein JWN82_118 [Candidatus Saccharibacteria bacterium]|nr:hypothetical protein [Candidatus Saccharibacteria bacterium]
MKELIGFAAVALAFVAYAPYFRDILRHKVQPHPFSWFIWGFAASLIFVLQILHGGGPGAYTTLTVAFISFIICILASRQVDRITITRHDWMMLGVALIALGVWLLVDQPTLAMLLLVSADMFGFIPSIRKTWQRPYSETLTMWAINGFRHGLSILALSSYTLLTLANPVVWTIGNFGFCAIILWRRRVMLRERH